MHKREQVHIVDDSYGLMHPPRFSREGQEPGTRTSHKLKPSPTTWPLIIGIGDTILLFSLIVVVLARILYVYLDRGVVPVRENSLLLVLTWSCFIIFSWSIATKVTHAYNIVNVSKHLKSFLVVFCSLVLMEGFWVLITSSFMTDEVAYMKIMLLFLFIATLILGLWRILIAELIRLPRFRSRAVIVGMTITAETIARDLLQLNTPWLRLLGYICEREDDHHQRDELPILGGLDTLHDLIHNGMADTIIMAIDHTASPEIFQEVINASHSGISVLTTSVVYKHLYGKLPVEFVGDQWYSVLPTQRAMSPLYLCWRFIMDITFGICATAILLLLLPVVALCIILDSPGPIFYTQERLGYRGKTFSIYKFRSMHVNAESNRTAIWATENDPRVTRVGRIMRAIHFDELPQAFNILRGDMSLIGPRPEREEFITELAQEILLYRCRLAVKPGLTGWAQVNYPYGRTTHDALIKLQYDLFYIKHRSFALDSLILLRTVIEVLFCRGT